jgi:deoxycytidine triphosphate deaminase
MGLAGGCWGLSPVVRLGVSVVVGWEEIGYFAG